MSDENGSYLLEVNSKLGSRTDVGLGFFPIEGASEVWHCQVDQWWQMRSRTALCYLSACLEREEKLSHRGHRHYLCLLAPS